MHKIMTVDKKYLNYTLDELTEDKKFITWVLKGASQNEWEQFLTENPEFRRTAIKAREIILLLRDKYEVLEEDEVVKIWQQVEQFDTDYQKKARNIKIRRIVSWAAIIFFVSIFGSLTYLYLNNLDLEYKFGDNTVISNSKDAKLVLSSGKEITLKNSNSKISVNSDKQLFIDNDSIIDLQQNNTIEENLERMNEVVIPYGKKSELLLADGTKVWLNAGSKLAFPTKFDENTREVYLEGEAYFEVAKKQNQTFIVNASDISIKVLGTHFDVSAYSNDDVIETVLLEGSVSIRKPGAFGLGTKEYILKPNQKANFDKQSNEVVISNEPDADFYIAWTDGWFRFSQQNLKSIFAKLGRFYNVKFVYTSNFTFDELITGKLDLKDSLEDVMKALNDVAKIEYKIVDNTIYIDKKIE